MHENEELTLNSNLKVARYHVFLNLEFAPYLVVWSYIYLRMIMFNYLDMKI